MDVGAQDSECARTLAAAAVLLHCLCVYMMGLKEGAGLAFLCSAGPSDEGKPSSEDNQRQLINFILGINSDVAAGSVLNFPALEFALQQQLEECEGHSCAAEAGPSQPSISPDVAGRLGPGVVNVDRPSVVGQFAYSGSGLTLESLGSFSSCRANVAVVSGKWFYECIVLTPGIQQVRGPGDSRPATAVISTTRSMHAHASCPPSLPSSRPATCHLGHSAIRMQSRFVEF